jgi:hypothetical protein
MKRISGVLWICFALGAGFCVTAQADDTGALKAAIKALQASVATLQTNNTALGAQVATLQSEIITLKANSVLALDGKLGLDGTTAVFAGVDVQITNGSGMTVGPTPAGNGGGNLIIGYNEPLAFAYDICSDGNLGVDPQPANSPVPAGCVAPAVWGNNQHTGRHNIVIGFGNSYTSFGGLVVGQANAISNFFAFATGVYNTASGIASSVSGGSANHAGGFESSVGGGVFNTASGYGSTVSGGAHNAAAGSFSSVTGGAHNTAIGASSSVSGGQNVTNPNITGWSAGSLTQ